MVARIEQAAGSGLTGSQLADVLSGEEGTDGEEVEFGPPEEEIPLEVHENGSLAASSEEE